MLWGALVLLIGSLLSMPTAVEGQTVVVAGGGGSFGHGGGGFCACRWLSLLIAPARDSSGCNAQRSK